MIGKAPIYRYNKQALFRKVFKKGNFDYEVSLYPWLAYTIQNNIEIVMDIICESL